MKFRRHRGKNIESSPHPYGATEELIDRALDATDGDEKVRLLEEATARNDGAAKRPQLMLATVLVHEGRQSEALSHLERLCRSDNERVGKEASFLLGAELSKGKDLKRGLRLLRERHEEGDKRATYILACRLREEGRVSEAIDLLRPVVEQSRGVESDDDDEGDRYILSVRGLIPNAREELGFAFFDLHRYEDVVSLARETPATEVRPRLRFRLAMSLEELGEKEEVERAFGR